MKRPALVSWSAILAVVGVACTSVSYAEPSPGAGGAAQTGDFRFEKVVAAPTRLELVDRNGPITVEAVSGDKLEVVAVKTGRAADLDRVKVVAHEESGAIVVCALWPEEDASSCRPGGPTRRGRGDGDGDDVKVRVELRARIPASVTALVARTMNGPIAASARGSIDAETMNGAVSVRATSGVPVHLATMNGGVELVLPPDAAADVDASTLNGRITSELGVVPSREIPAIHEAHFRIGAGGAAISLHTLNGRIAIRRL
jgi:hypothetical protein